MFPRRAPPTAPTTGPGADSPADFFVSTEGVRLRTAWGGLGVPRGPRPGRGVPGGNAVLWRRGQASPCPRSRLLPESPAGPRQPSKVHTSVPLTPGFPSGGAPPWGCRQNPALVLTLLGLCCLQPPAGSMLERDRPRALGPGPSAVDNLQHVPVTMVMNKDRPLKDGPGDPHLPDTPPQTPNTPSMDESTWEGPNRSQTSTPPSGGQGDPSHPKPHSRA